MTDPRADEDIDRHAQALLDDLFAHARDHRPQASAALMGRVLADAQAAQRAPVIRPFWRDLWELWPVTSGAVLAGLGGVILGVNLAAEATLSQSDLFARLSLPLAGQSSFLDAGYDDLALLAALE